MHLWGLSPFGPIFGKELRVASRRRRNYLLRVLYLGALLLFLLLAWSVTVGLRFGPTGIAARQQQQEQLGWMFFIFFSMFSVIAMGLIGPVLTSTAINGERLSKTLHVLLMTPLTAWQIVAGKLFSRLLTALTLIGLSLPVLALVRLLGGVELGQMFGVLALSAVTAMTSAALGLLLSILLHRAYAVILVAYVALGVVYLFLPIMMMAFAAGTGARGMVPWLSMIAAINPFWCTGLLSSGQMRMLSVGWTPCVLVHLGVTALLLVVSALLLRRVGRREGEAAAAIPAPVPIAVPIPALAASPTNDPSDAVAERLPLPAPPLLRAPPPLPGAARISRDVSDQPVLWRELRRPLMSKRWQRIAGSIFFLALLLLSYLAAGVNDTLDDHQLQFVYAFVFHTLIMLLTCVLAATSIAQEKEGDQWTVLLASPLSGWQIIWGKTLGTARRLLWPMAAVAAHFFLFTIGGVINPTTFLICLLVIALFNVIWIATGVTLSLWCRKVTVAVIVNLALPIVLYGVAALMLQVIDSMLLDRQQQLVRTVGWWLPYYWIGEGIDNVNSAYSTNQPDLPGPHGRSVPPQLFLGYALVIGLLHLAVAALVLGLTAARFNSIVGRAWQHDRLRHATRGGGGSEGGAGGPGNAATDASWPSPVA